MGPWGHGSALTHILTHDRKRAESSGCETASENRRNGGTNGAKSTEKASLDVLSEATDQKAGGSNPSWRNCLMGSSLFAERQKHHSHLAEHHLPVRANIMDPCVVQRQSVIADFSENRHFVRLCRRKALASASAFHSDVFRRTEHDAPCGSDPCCACVVILCALWYTGRGTAGTEHGIQEKRDDNGYPV